MARKRKTKPEKQAGGYLQSPSHEEGGIPAYTPGQPPIELEGEEYIINAATTKALGVEFLDKLNRTASPHHSQPGFNRGQLPDSNYKGGGVVKKLERGGINNKNKPNGLPENYRLSDVSGKNCKNCIFFRGYYCKKWKSKVGGEYLCNVWDGNKMTKRKILGEN